MFGFDLYQDSYFPWLTNVFVLPKILFRKLVYVVVSSFSTYENYSSQDHHVTIGTVVVHYVNCDAWITSDIPLLYPSLQSVNKDELSIIIDPYWCHMRGSVLPQRRYMSEVLGLYQLDCSSFDVLLQISFRC